MRTARRERERKMLHRSYHRLGSIQSAFLIYIKRNKLRLGLFTCHHSMRHFYDG